MEATIPSPRNQRTAGTPRKRQRVCKSPKQSQRVTVSRVRVPDATAPRPAPQSPHTATGDVRAGVLAIRAADPDATASEIAAQLGVSRARIGQLLRKLGLPTITPRSVALWGRPRRQARVDGP